MTPPYAPLQQFMLASHQIRAQDCVQGFFVNPDMPPMFDDCPNEDRSFEHMVWWMRPFIEGEPGKWGVRILDGGAWDRSNWVSNHAELEDAVKACQWLVLHPRFLYKVTPVKVGNAEVQGMEKLDF